jgi:hypothetical protein
LLGSIWAFLRWWRSPRLSWALGAGALGGLAILCRETAGPLVVTMAAFAVMIRPAGTARSCQAALAMVAVAALVVAPWTIRTYVRTGKFIPVAAATGTVLAEGNNECLAADPVLSWYWAEGLCPPLQAAFNQRLSMHRVTEWDDVTLVNEIKREMGREFIRDRTIDYLALTLRRAATIMLPFHPRQPLSLMRQAVMTTFWLAVVPLGIAGIILSLRREHRRSVILLTVLLVGAVIVPQVLIYFSPDMRYRMPADLLLACFAGYVVARRVPGVDSVAAQAATSV